MSQFDTVADGELIWVVDNPEEAEKQMRENDGRFSGMLRPQIKNPECFKLICIPESEGAIDIWTSVVKRIETEKINVRSDIHVRTKKWLKRPIKYFAAVINEKTGDAPVMALVSQKTVSTGLWINLITTSSPLQPRPYTTLLQNGLRQFAQERLHVELMIPKEYQVSEAEPVLIENEKAILMNGDDVIIDGAATE